MCKLIFKGVLLLIAHSMSILGLLEPVHHLAFLANFRHQTVPRAYVYITQWLYLCWFSHTVPLFDKTLTFSRVFHPKFFWQFFSWNQSCQQLKSPKPQHFHEFFTPQKSTISSGNQSWIFGQKMKISNSVKIQEAFSMTHEMSLLNLYYASFY